MRAYLILLLSFLTTAFGCKPDAGKDAAMFSLLPVSHTGVDFSNDIAQNDSLNVLEYMYFYNGGGVGIGDVNNDGLPDLFFAGNMVSSRLYLNKGNLQFEDITEKAGLATQGWCSGVAMADVNHDGYLDVYVSRAGSKIPAERANLLFINNGNNTFTESAEPYGLADTGYSTQAAFFDYDQDGHLDLYLLTHDHAPTALNTPTPKKVRGEGKNTDKLYRNNGNGTFSDVSAAAGILTEGYGLGVAISDLNQDGWPDIYVSNDFLSNDLLYVNNGNGTFTNRIKEYLRHQAYNGMGADVADYNNDGLPDILVLDMLPEENYRQKMMLGGMNNDKFDLILQQGYEPQYMRNTLQLNNGNGSFSEIGQLAGIDKTDWSWSPLFADYDNDGHKDLFITNGYHKDITDKDFMLYSKSLSMFQEERELNKTLLSLIQQQAGIKVPNYAFRNNGDLTFSNTTEAWGFEVATFSNGSAFTDLDNDGDLDLVISNLNEPASIYQNKRDKFPANNYLQLSLKGDQFNPLAIGAKVALLHQGQLQYQENTLYRGFQSSMVGSIHFGLGTSTQADSLEVFWPDGKALLLTSVKANQRITLHYKDASVPSADQAPQGQEPVFREVSGELGLRYLHQENGYSDFKLQPLLPHALSASGPALAAGDVDGDGLEDLFIGGTAGNAASLFLQQPSGRFTHLDFPSDRQYEDMGALLFDCDNDGDLDLYVVSGGSEFPAGSGAYQDRLYTNDGHGNFSRSKGALPVLTASGSCVTAADFDQDGDLDLFVGGRVIPGKFPLPPQSYILRNEGGRFVDVTATVCPEVKHAGLVTSALWTDFDNDGQTDLLVAGEWMPLTFFKNTRGKLSNSTASSGLGNTSGWWNSLAGGDFDNDGDTDYVAGNVGLNIPFRPTAQEPLVVYADDFDANGVFDALICRNVNGKQYPLATRDVLTDQIPGFRNKFKRYRDYAEAEIEDVVSEEALQKAFTREGTYPFTAYLENLGNGRFSIRPLPMQSQFAPVYGMLMKDVDGDHQLDILLTGNSYASDVTIGRHDAFSGLYLKGDGKGDFSPVPLPLSGFAVRADAKALVELHSKERIPLLVAGANADTLKAFIQPNAPTQHIIRIHTLDAQATLSLPQGKRKVEFHYGSGYLSQSSRGLVVPGNTKSVLITDYSGQSREVSLATFITLKEKQAR